MPRVPLSTQLLENAINEIYVFSGVSLTFQYANARARGNIGYSMEELRHKTPLLLSPGLSTETFQQLLTSAAVSGGHRFQTRYQRKDGSRYDVEVHLSRAVHEREPVWVAVALDITDVLRVRRQNTIQTEAAQILNRILTLSLRNTPLTPLLQEVIDALVCSEWLALSPSGGAFTRQPGGTFQLVVDRNLPPAVQVACAQIRSGECLCGRAAQSRQIQFAACVDERHRPLEGMKAHGHYNIPVVVEGVVEAVLVLYLEHGHVCDPQEVAFLENIAAALAGAIQRQRAQDDLVEAREQAMAASRAKSQFLASMSHELRTPMNGIIGLAELLMTEDLSDAARGHAEVLHSSSKSLLQIVNNILDISKIEAGRVDLEALPIPLPELLRELVQQQALLAQRKGLRLSTWLAPDLPSLIQGDPTRLRQVIINLLNNAIKFTRDGQITLRAQRSGPDRLSISVEDTGIGIPSERIDAIFETFTQADSSTTRHYGGTGLGLSICRQLVELMGGRLSVRSTLGVGSTFTIDLPAAEVRPPAEARPAPAARPVLHGLRLLVAEDNLVNQRVIAAQLERLGVQHELVSDGAAALCACLDQAYDLVLMDHHMPLLDGLAATRLLRERGYTGLIYAMTASAFDEDVQAAYAAGMDGFLSKPLSIERLQEALAAAAAQVAPVS